MSLGADTRDPEVTLDQITEVLGALDVVASQADLDEAIRAYKLVVTPHVVGNLVRMIRALELATANSA